MLLPVLASMSSLKAGKSVSSVPSTSPSLSSKHDELMDVGLEFVTENATAATKSSRPPATDSQLHADSTATHQVGYSQWCIDYYCPVQAPGL